MASLHSKKPGIGFVAPSGQVLDESALECALDYFRARGFRVHCPAPVRRSHQRFAGDDRRRLDALHAVAARPDIDIVMAVRGGYGLSRLLHQIDWSNLAASGKIFIGHSDFTALNAALYSKGKAISLCGPMACYDFGAQTPSPYTEAHFFGVLEKRVCEVEISARNPYDMHLAGKIWGGNLALIAHLVGTPYLPNIRGGILFVEDINEHPYRIERMIYQLEHAGILARQRALVLGDFSGYRLQPNDNGYDFDKMVAHLRQRLTIPVITGLPFGHCRDKITIPFGAQVKLDVAPDRFLLRMSGHPTLRS